MRTIRTSKRSTPRLMPRSRIAQKWWPLLLNRLKFVGEGNLHAELSREFARQLPFLRNNRSHELLDGGRDVAELFS